MRKVPADRVILVVLVVVSQVEVWAFGRLGGTALAALIAGAAAVLLFWRKAHPLAVAAVECVLMYVAAGVSEAHDKEPISITFLAVLIIAWFTLGDLGDRRRAVLGLALGLAFAGVATHPFRVDVYLAIAFTTFGVPWLVGSLAWSRRQIAETLKRPSPGTDTQLKMVADPAALAALSPRESEVLSLMAAGRSNAEIAAELHVSLATVKTHVVSILRKLGVRDRTQAVVVALSQHPSA